MIEPMEKRTNEREKNRKQKRMNATRPTDFIHNKSSSHKCSMHFSFGNKMSAHKHLSYANDETIPMKRKIK